MDNFLHSREGKSRILCHLLQEFPFWLDRTRDGCAAFLWIFDRSFADCTDVFLPNLRPDTQTFPFGSIVPNKTSQITGAHVHLKSMARSEHNLSLRIIWMDNQYSFLRIGVIPALQDRLC